MLLLAGIAVDLFASQQFYRYRNDAGVLVLDYKVPTHLVKNGYEVVSPSGQTLEVVAPYKEQTEEELREAERVERQKQEDILLLKSYSSLDELYGARDRKLQGLQREIDLVTDNLAESKTLLDNARAQAAAMQRSGRPVRDNMVEQIDRLIAEISDGKQLLIVREKEIKEVSTRYDRYAARFKILLGLEASTQKSPASDSATGPATSQLDDG